MSMNDDVYMICGDDITESAQDLIDAATRKKTAEGRRLFAVPSKADGVGTARSPGTKPAKAQGAGAVALSLSSRQSKRPWIAATLSLLVCGAGQIYNRQAQLGLLFLLTECFYIVAHWSMMRLWPAIREFGALLGAGEIGLILGVATADAAMVFVMGSGVHQAYRRGERDSGGEFEGMRSPLLSGIGSLLVPGWGQIFNAQIGKACFFFGFILGAALVVAFAVLTPLGGLLGDMRNVDSISVILGVSGAAVLMWALSIYDAVLVAGLRRHHAV